MPHLYNLTAVPAGWPLETVLDAFLHLTKYDPADAKRPQETLAARLVELWAARPAEAAAWRGLNEDRSQERLAELLVQHGRSEVSRWRVISFSEAGLKREAVSWTPPPEWWEARLRPRCSELAGRLAAAEAEAEETARKRQKVEEKEAQLREERAKCRELSDRLAAAEERAAQLQAAHDERGRLADRLAESEASAAKAAERESELGKSKQRCRQLERRLAAEERCQQLYRQLLEAKEEALRLNAGPVLCDGPASLGRGVAEEDVASSILSRSSWFSVKPDCFMPDAIFKTRSYGTDFFLMGRDLQKGSRVVAGDDTSLLKVVEVKKDRATEVVNLQAGAALLRVTSNHLVQTHHVEGSGYVEAGDLKAGDLVMMDSGEPTPLTKVDVQHKPCEVLKIVFEPDLPIAVFSCPPCILSKGQKRKAPTRRGGMWQRGARQADQTADGRFSIPNTAGNTY